MATITTKTSSPTRPRVIGSRKAMDPIRDLATDKGETRIVQMAVEDYLATLGIYDGAGVTDWDESVTANFQRGRLDIRKNTIKQRMLRDLLRGGTLPPLVLYQDRPDGGERPKLIDGLQRTDVIREALKALLARENGDEIEPYIERQIKEMSDLGQEPLSSDDFLRRVVTVQFWHGLMPEELIRLFMVLNVGQQKVSPRHLLEVLAPELRKMFESWGLAVMTEREQKQRATRPVDDEAEPEEGEAITPFKYEYLLMGLLGYVNRDPQVKTSKVLKDEGSAFPDQLSEQVVQIGSELCKQDFSWVCGTLNEFIKEKYADTPKWAGFIQNSDNYFIPIMAALGWARQTPKFSDLVESRKKELISVLKNSDSDDPMAFMEPHRGLNKVSDTVKSNIGRKRRAIVHAAWRKFLADGITDPEYPLDWEYGQIMD